MLPASSADFQTDAPALAAPAASARPALPGDSLSVPGSRDAGLGRRARGRAFLRGGERPGGRQGLSNSEPARRTAANEISDSLSALSFADLANQSAFPGQSSFSAAILLDAADGRAGPRVFLLPPGAMAGAAPVADVRAAGAESLDADYRLHAVFGDAVPDVFAGGADRA